ncbi:MAG TPA: MFS transporter [Chthoniobacter sp.]|jgi:ACS family hexuronate transporter-like MFS transporter
MNREAIARRSNTWRWWITGLLLLATMLNYMDRQTLASVAKRITDEFHLSQEQYGDIEFSFGWGFAAGSLAFGILADMINVRWLYPMVLFGWSAMGLLSGFTHGYMPMLACRALLGFFESGQWPCALRTTQAVLSDGQRSLGNSVLQSGASLGAVFTPLILRTMVAGNSAPGAWRPAFMMVGALGMVWIVVWLASNRRSDFTVERPAETKPQTTSEWWREIGRDRRFWALVVMVIAINIIWHITRAWLTKFLQQGRNYSESDALLISSAFYIATDVGCLLSGAAALWLTRRKLDAHRARLWVFGICSIITGLTSVLVLLPKGYLLLGVLFVIGAAALGLFPCYYSFTQELGARHVGKATGLLSTIGWLVASPLQKYFGKLVDQTHSFDLGISLVGWVPLVALVTMLLFWRSETKPDTL